MKWYQRAAISVTAIVVASGCSPEQIFWWANADREASREVIEHVVRDAAHEMGVDPELMVRVQRCENNSGDPTLKNRSSSARGIFQFLDTTWERARFRLYERGIDSAPYEVWDVSNPVAASRVAANMVAEGGLSAWNASRHCWSR